MQVELLFKKASPFLLVPSLPALKQSAEVNTADQLDSNSNELMSSNGSIDIRYKIFFSLWAVASLFHMANHRTFTIGMDYLLLSIAAGLLILKPASIARMLFFLSLQLYESFKMFPSSSNHWLFTTLVNLTIVHALFYLIIKRKSFRINRVELFKTFAPLVRVELIILYAYVVLHKLNTAFFATGVSCASEFLAAQNTLSLLPVTEAVKMLSAYGTIVIEVLIPVLLCFRRTRNWGILVGLSFHFFLAFNPINGFYDFSSMVFAAYVVFSCGKFSAQVYHLHNSLRKLKVGIKNQYFQFSVSKFVFSVLLFVFAVVCAHFLFRGVDDFFRYFFWASYGVIFIAVIILTIFFNKVEAAPDDVPQRIRHFSLLIFPFVVLINGMCPYLGLKTENSFAMFSNLRTEGGITNHFFIPVETQIFDYQKDVVEIVSSSDPQLQAMAERDRLLVFTTFRNFVRKLKPETVVYIRNGKQHTFNAATAAKSDELLQANSFFVNKFLRFRSISKHDPQPCSH